MTTIDLSVKFAAGNPRAQAAMSYIDRLIDKGMDAKTIRKTLHTTAGMLGGAVLGKSQEITAARADQLQETRVARAYLSTLERPESVAARRLFESAVLGTVGTATGKHAQPDFARQIRNHARHNGMENDKG